MIQQIISNAVKGKEVLAVSMALIEDQFSSIKGRLGQKIPLTIPETSTGLPDYYTEFGPEFDEIGIRNVNALDMVTKTDGTECTAIVFAFRMPQGPTHVAKQYALSTQGIDLFRRRLGSDSVHLDSLMPAPQPPSPPRMVSVGVKPTVVIDLCGHDNNDTETTQQYLPMADKIISESTPRERDVITIEVVSNLHGVCVDAPTTPTSIAMLRTAMINTGQLASIPGRMRVTVMGALNVALQNNPSSQPCLNAFDASNMVDQSKCDPDGKPSGRGRGRGRGQSRGRGHKRLIKTRDKDVLGSTSSSPPLLPIIPLPDVVPMDIIGDAGDRTKI